MFNLFIPADLKLAEDLVSDRNIPLISFTGSSAVGRGVSKLVAHRLGCSILELSGNNAIIVDQTADALYHALSNPRGGDQTE